MSVHYKRMSSAREVCLNTPEKMCCIVSGQSQIMHSAVVPPVKDTTE